MKKKVLVLQEANHCNEYSCSDFPDNQCLHLMYSEVAWVLASLRTQIWPQIILGLDHLPDYLSISCDYASHKTGKKEQTQPAITCSKLTTETLEQGVKHVQRSFWYLYC